MRKYLTYLLVILFALICMLLLQAHTPYSQSSMEIQPAFPNWAKTKVRTTIPNGELSLKLQLGQTAKTQISLIQSNGEHMILLHLQDLSPGKHQFTWDMQKVKTNNLVLRVLVDGVTKTHRIQLDKHQITD